MRKRRKRKFALRRFLAVLLCCCLLVFGIAGGRRAYHIFMTSTGRQLPDVPDSAVYPVRGVDISYYQGNIDWDVLCAQDISFAFIKATEGVDHNDTQFLQSWESAAQADIFVGAYHFYRFEDSGAQQAQNFMDTVPVRENTLPPVIDVELYPSLENEPDAADTRENLQEMLDILEQHYGVKPILYAAPNTYRKYIRYFSAEYPVWISNYYYEPYLDWTFWQYTDDGLLDGYDGDQIHIDLNVYRGTREEFLTEFGLTE